MSMTVEPTVRAKRGSLADWTPEQKRERQRQQNKAACERRAARKAAAKLGLQGPPLLATAPTDDAERKRRAAECERRRRANMTAGEREAYLERERARGVGRRDPVESRLRYEATKADVITKVAHWQAKNPDKVRIYKDRQNERTRLLKQTDPEKYAKRLEQRRKREALRRRADPAYRVMLILRSSLRQALKLYAQGRKTTSTATLIGCTIPELVAHIEAQWLPGMSWANHAPDGWHIDHKKPCAAFDLLIEEEQRRCFHYTNLQPLWADANRRKSAKGAGRGRWVPAESPITLTA
jgi:hypothetical protein